ncbi:zinc-dependent alcohol dehydrogenase [Saccharothrix coeruleofusca]|uniref:zinc-dependent alcohol dehydrogenase n=1 Tax=Saccharothrix coeruleofusca TaxID=33919 RepID=UPI001E624A33|nr:alcohol dehydrogenase catalytic domain-containing protein [Saccharothrix coeruleofusca]
MSISVPPCGEDEVLLQTEAVSICSTDVSYYRGHLEPARWPITPGHEYVGRVVRVGSRVTGVEWGDRLVYWGQTDFDGLAEYRVIRPLLPNQPGQTIWYTERNFYDSHQAAAVVVPDGLASGLATMVEPLTSILRCLLVNPPKPGDVCVVLGCGPSALLAVQLLSRVLGAARVLVIEQDARRIALARRFGADSSFNIVTQASELVEFVREHHDSFADYVLDALPHVAPRGEGPDVRSLAMGLLKPGGEYVFYGATMLPQPVSTWHVLAKGLHLRATPFDVRAFPMTRSAHCARTALALISQGVVEVEPLITRTLSFDDDGGVRDAFENYGADGGLKTSIVFEHALELPSVPRVDAVVTGVG